MRLRGFRHFHRIEHLHRLFKTPQLCSCSYAASALPSTAHRPHIRIQRSHWVLKIIEICSAHSLLSSRSGKLRISRPLKVAIQQYARWQPTGPSTQNAVCSFTRTRLTHHAQRFLRHVRKKIKSLTAVTSPFGVPKGRHGKSSHVQQCVSLLLCERTVAVSIASWLHSLTIFRVEGITRAIADKVETKQALPRGIPRNNGNHGELPPSSLHHSAMHSSC